MLLTALEAGGFRAWQLPADIYGMKQQFKMPYLRVALIGVTLGGILWMLLLVFVLQSLNIYIFKSARIFVDRCYLQIHRK